MAKAESGRLHTDPAQVNLPALFGRLRGLARPMADGKPIEVVVDDAGIPETIFADEVALTSILRNLLANGIKYTDRGEVRLSARVLGPLLELTVTDTGIGIQGRPARTCLRGVLPGARGFSGRNRAGAAVRPAAGPDPGRGPGR